MKSVSPARNHLRLVPPREEDTYEKEVLEALRQISPEGAPASARARRLSLWLFFAVVVIEGTTVLVAGWHYYGWQGALIGLLMLFVTGTLRAVPILMAASARRRDWERAVAIVEERRRWRKQNVESPDEQP